MRSRLNQSPLTRKRQVRHAYPGAFIELAILMLAKHGASKVSNTLQLPKSTIYRWSESCRPLENRFQHQERDRIDRIETLVRACEILGFTLRHGVSLLESIPGTRNTTDQYEPDALIASRSVINKSLTAVAAQAPAETTNLEAKELERAPDSKRTRLELACREIDTGYYRKLSCDTLAKIAVMSRFHFIKMFKSVYDTTPYRRLTMVRIEHAKHLLRTSAQPLAIVASAVGFDTLTSFSRCFKTVEGISLSSFYHGARMYDAGSTKRFFQRPVSVSSTGATR